jgi:small subunit ribosomal protein S18
MKNLTMNELNFKNTKLLQRFLTPSGNIVPRSKSGLSAKLQRRLAREIKRARHMAMLPFTTQI